mgnify:CR=1 FL=1
MLLLDAKSLGGTDHATPLHASNDDVAGSGRDGLLPMRLAACGSDGRRERSWILLPIAGPSGEAASPSTNGAITTGAVMALKVIDAGGALSLEPGWVSHNLAAPATPITVNGVVFTLATGLPATSAGRGTPAVLNAYDGATGRRLWTSEKAMTTFASPGSLWTGSGQIYVGAHDGTLYAFGFNDERRSTNGE